jgi:hypothetical protein
MYIRMSTKSMCNGGAKRGVLKGKLGFIFSTWCLYEGKSVGSYMKERVLKFASSASRTY